MRNQKQLKVILLAVILNCTHTNGFTQINQDSIEWKKVSQKLIASINKFHIQSTTFKEYSGKLKQKIFFFIGNVESAQVIPPKESLDVLNNDLVILDGLVFGSVNRTDSVYLCLKYLDSAYQRRNNLEGFYTFSPYVIQSIKVRIMVTRGDRDMQGYDVECRTKLWMNKKALWHSDRPRSPCDIEIPPGIYIFSVLREGQEIKRVEREIGLRGSVKNQVIEISL